MPAELTRRPCVAGRFYSAAPSVLRAEIEGYLAAGSALAEKSDAPPLAFIAPHAGYVFSGRTAGLALGSAPVPESVIMLGPNHTGQGASLAVWPSGAWLTPLGASVVDETLAATLLRNMRGAAFSASPAAHVNEHSLEVLLPFLQVARPDVKILPVCVAEYNLEKLAAAGEALADCVKDARKEGKSVALLGSTDMSHYIPHSEAERLDGMALQEIEALNPEGLHRTVRAHGISMCGIAPVTMLLYACRSLGATRGRVVSYTSSGVTGADYGASMDQVVGYAGVLID